MSSWGEKMASVVTACAPRPATQGLPYHRKVEKVKFGVPLDQVCKKDIPGPLLVMLLKINKEGPFKKDVFRAPGHQGNMNKLIHFLQQGRLVNIHNFSVNTIASVLKQFLRKIPGGIFGKDNEALLFTLFSCPTQETQLSLAQRVFLSLPIYSQHLLVLLFGTFRVIHGNSESAKTGMTAEALGVSVAPSFFQTCVSEGKIAKPEEVQKFKEFIEVCLEKLSVATKLITFFIEHFGMRDLFGRDNYEYYARLTGRILKVEDEWIFFTYPTVAFLKHSGSHEDVNLVAEDAEVEGNDCLSASEVDGASGLHESVAANSAVSSSLDKSKTGSLEIIPENCSLDPFGRLSTSLDDKNISTSSSCGSPHQRICPSELMMAVASKTESHVAGLVRRGTRSQEGQMKSNYTCLPQVHQKQTERMKYRSEWFLSDPTGLVTVKCRSDRPSSLQQAACPLPPPAPPSASSSTCVPLPAARRTTANQSLARPVLSTCGRSSLLWPQLPSPASKPHPKDAAALLASGAQVCDSKRPLTSSMSTTCSPALASPYLSMCSILQKQNTTAGSTEPATSLQGSVRLRRRLSDKEKERHLVRRSSSKRKDKENGDSNSSLEKASTVASSSSPSESAHSRSASLKRTMSAEEDRSAGGKSGSRHHALCRTGSQDTPHVSATVASDVHSGPAPASVASSTECSSTRSLPRI